jgi:hypothetical protein
MLLFSSSDFVRSGVSGDFSRGFSGQVFVKMRLCKKRFPVSIYSITLVSVFVRFEFRWLTKSMQFSHKKGTIKFFSRTKK